MLRKMFSSTRQLFSFRSFSNRNLPLWSALFVKEPNIWEVKNFPIYPLQCLVQKQERNLCFCNSYSYSSVLIQDCSQVMLQGFSELVARIRKECPALWNVTGIWALLSVPCPCLGICSGGSWVGMLGRMALHSEPPFSDVYWYMVL